MKITYWGHSCFTIQLSDTLLMIDPFISGNPKAKNIDLSQFRPDFILLSHGHEDHVLDAEQIAKQSGAKIISNFEIVDYYSKKGIEGHPLNQGGSWKFPFGKVKYVNAVHSSSRGDGTYMGNPGGFLVEADSKHFYFAGDTALTFDMQLIPMTSPPLDFCFLPVGDNFTMGVDDALIASDFVKCDTVIGCHFDSFPYIEIDHIVSIQKFYEKGKKLILPTIGSDVTL